MCSTDSSSVVEIGQLRREVFLAREGTLLDPGERVRRLVAHRRADGGVDGHGQVGAITDVVGDAAYVLVWKKEEHQTKNL